MATSPPVPLKAGGAYGPAPGANLQPLRSESFEMPQLGATFVPGGFDDYLMPEVIAPSPQRVMPEVPQNMQEDLQRLENQFSELEASENSRQQQQSRSTATAASTTNNTSNKPAAQTATPYDREPSPSKASIGGGGGGGGGLNKYNNYNNNYSSSQAPGSIPQIREPEGTFKAFSEQPTNRPDKPAKGSGGPGAMAAPSFSPFPKVKGDNIPPSDEEKEEILHNARNHVLHSNNVSMQLSWARDSLAWVDTAQAARQREARILNRSSYDGGETRPGTPKTEHELRIDALSIVRYLCDQSHPEALFMRAKWYEFGKFGIRPDKKDAYFKYEHAAQKGWPRAEYRMGMLFEDANDMSKAIEHYMIGLQQFDSAARYRIGMMHLLGQHGFRQDMRQGLELIQEAADSADEDAPQGAYVYGMLISRDLPDLVIPEELLPCNLGLARQYIEKAAYLGMAKAQSKMGQAYELCQLGCDFNPAYSLHYYGLAARQSLPEAALGVSRWFLFGYEGVFAKNEQLAFKYAQEAADAHLATGEFAMGYYYEIGIHVPKDLGQARAWYQKAADNGNKDAVQRLESLSQAKSLTKQDHETTTLTRIQSQHGSMRGKRPDRFKQGQKDAPRLPALAETEGGAMGQYDMPDPARPSSAGRPPAFTVNLDGNMPVRPKSTAPYPDDDGPPVVPNVRPASVAPYPEDDVLMGPGGGGARRPAGMPANYNNNGPQMRPGAIGGGPLAERPRSAFGIRPLSPSGQPYPGGAQQQQQGPGIRQSQSAGTGIGGLAPQQQQQQPPRGRVVSAGPGWEPQAPAGYRQASPGRQPMPQYDQQQGGRPPIGGGGTPIGDPTRNRLTKQNPSAMGLPAGPQPQYAQVPPAGYQSPPSQQSPPFQQQQGSMPNAAQPGRDYGPRTSSRPVSVADSYDRYNNNMSAPPPLQGGGPPHNNGYGPRTSSMPMQPGQQQGGGGGGGYGMQPSPLKNRPTQMMDNSGRSSAPPMQMAGGAGGPGPGGRRPSPGPSFGSQGGGAPPGRKPVGSGTTSPANKPVDNRPQGQGPATFEAMGIPQGKNDSDCIVM